MRRIMAPPLPHLGGTHCSHNRLLGSKKQRRLLTRRMTSTLWDAARPWWPKAARSTTTPARFAMAPTARRAGAVLH